MFENAYIEIKLLLLFLKVSDNFAVQLNKKIISQLTLKVTISDKKWHKFSHSAAHRDLLMASCPNTERLMRERAHNYSLDTLCPLVLQILHDQLLFFNLLFFLIISHSVNTLQ